MNGKTETHRGAADSWDAYWHGTADAGAYARGGANHPGIRAFWVNRFEALRQAGVTPSLLDIASGNGAVVETAIESLGGSGLDITCIDISAAAIASIEERFPEVRGLVCDGGSIPLESGSFKMVTSQFGVEYAGKAAIEEAARLLGPGGRLTLLLHHKSGVIHAECSDNLAALNVVRDSRFVPLAADMFRHGFAAVRGANRTAYDEAAKKLAPAVEALESVMGRYGRGVAGDTIARLYSDVARIHEELPQYDPGEVLAWLERMQSELETYAGRMVSMIDSAMGEDEFESTCALLEDRHCTIEQSGPMYVPDYPRPLAWVVMASKPGLQPGNAA